MLLYEDSYYEGCGFVVFHTRIHSACILFLAYTSFFVPSYGREREIIALFRPGNLSAAQTLGPRKHLATREFLAGISHDGIFGRDMAGTRETRNTDRMVQRKNDNAMEFGLA